MKNTKTVLAFLSAMVIGMPAHAVTGNKFLEQLRSSSTSDFNATTAYLQGVIESEEVHVAAEKTFAMREGREPSIARYFCTPVGSTLEQAREIVLGYLANNPGERHRGAAPLIQEALWKTWRCLPPAGPTVLPNAYQKAT